MPILQDVKIDFQILLPKPQPEKISFHEESLNSLSARIFLLLLKSYHLATPPILVRETQSEAV